MEAFEPSGRFGSVSASPEMNKVEDSLIDLVGFCINGLEICFIA